MICLLIHFLLYKRANGWSYNIFGLFNSHYFTGHLFFVGGGGSGVNVTHWTCFLIFNFIYNNNNKNINITNCHSIFTIVEVLNPYKSIYIYIYIYIYIILELTTTKNKGIMKKEVLHSQHFSQHFHNKS